MEQTLKKINDFHGHIGPYAVLGYKMGLIANKKLGEDPFCKKAVVYTDTKPPHSCIIDGIQLSSNCTLGKGNIKIKKKADIKVEFSNNQKEKVTTILKPYIKKEIDSMVTEENILEYSEKYFKMKNSDLFEII